MSRVRSRWALQSLWDLTFARRPVLVLLVGSDEAMMDRLFEHDRLYSAARRQSRRRAVQPAETAQALGGSRSAVEVFDTQLVTGGFPSSSRMRESSDPLGPRRDALLVPHPARGHRPDQPRGVRGRCQRALVLEAVGADEIGVVNFSRIASDLGGGIAAKTAVSRATDILADTKRILAVDIQQVTRAAGSSATSSRSYLRFWFRFGRTPAPQY